MRVQDVDVVDAEPLEAGVDDVTDVLGAAAVPEACVNPNLVARTTSSRKPFTARPTVISFSPQP